MPAPSAEAAVALAAAATWGGGDFAGGMAVKAAGGSVPGTLRVIILAHAASLAVLLSLILLTHGTLPHGAPVVWGLAAGVSGALSLTAFYIALARGTMGPSAAVSGLLAAAIPALVSAVLEGAPSPLHLAGFVLAALAIWAIAAGNTKDAPGIMPLAIAGGIGFGIYFVALRQANSLGAFTPVALARCASITTCTLLWVALRRRPAPGSAHRAGLNKQAIAWAMGIAVFDTAGNLLYLAATRMGRLDIAAVLSALYPAGTILLAAWTLHEKPTRKQLAGMAIAVIAVVMITL